MDLAALKEQLEYSPSTGLFTWLDRPRRHFKSDHAWKAWNAKMAGTTAGTRGGKYITINIKPIRQYAHRLAWFYVHGVSPTGEIDHINGDRQDNRIANLRIVTGQENRRNQRIRSDNTSGVVGVVWLKRYRKWRAVIYVGGKAVTLGRFSSKDDAVSARASAERTHGFHPNHGRAG